MTLNELAERLGGTVNGDGTRTVSSCAAIDDAGPTDVTFLASPKYAKFLATTEAAVVLVGPDATCPDGLTHIVFDDPYYAFRNALVELVGFRPQPDPMATDTDAEGRMISPRANVHPTARLGAGVRLHPGATAEANCVIGDRSILYPGAYVGPDATVGEDCVLYPNVTLYDRCRIGDRVTVHSSSVIGQDGFGYATHNGVHTKIPQTGIVVIGDDVELGAGCAIERAALGETRIGSGTKFADLISIGHGTKMGDHCLLVSLVGVAGSVTMGNYVVLGGQVAVAGHLSVGDGVQAAGRCAIASDIAPGRKVGGVPAVDLDQSNRNALTGRNLYDLSRRVRKLERKSPE